ncbi:cobalamin biosynthesis protein CobG [Streptomyces sp. WMMB 322]|uniref:cobalamin biosynthesis protein CobG n=1 Tax=Streptomyces sp. WMMB 322 TaxID=1286821 RepID=UPI0034A0CBCC
MRLHEADDGALARVRVPGGILSVPQAEALAAAARRFGDGDLHLTSRGNVQLRALEAGCGGELAGLLGAAGLLPSHLHERVRNVVASPLAGLDGRGHGDVRPWLRTLDGMLCGSESAHALSGRFLFALDDGRGDMTDLGADVTLTAGGEGTAWLRAGPGHAPAVQVPSSAAPLAALLTAEAFLQTPAARAGQAWRIGELPDGIDELTDTVLRRLDGSGVAATTSPEPPGPRTSGPPPPGAVHGPHGDAALSVLAPMGRIEAAQWDTLVSVAARTGHRELRLTPWRGLVLPGVPADAAAEHLRVLASAGLITDPASHLSGVGSCIGRPGCAKSLADVRSDAAALTGPGRLPVHWSGCERRCGHPRGDRVEVVAVPEGYRVSVDLDGRTRSATTTGRAAVAAHVAAARTSSPEDRTP